MKIYSRYVLGQAVKWLILVFFGLLFVVIFGLVAKVVFDGVPLATTVLVMPFLLPEGLSYTIPIATLFGMGIAFTLMVHRGEIITFKVVGAPLWKVFLPVYIVLLGISLATVKINDLSTSTARERTNQTILNSFEKIIVSQLRKEKTYSELNSAYILDVTDVAEDGTLINPTFQFKKEKISGSADYAKLGVAYNADSPQIFIDFYNSKTVGNGSEFIFPRDFHLEIPLSEIYNKNKRVDPRASEVAQTIAKLNEERNAYHRQMAAQSSFAFLCGNIDETSKREWQDREGREWSFKRRNYQYRLVGPRNWANGMTCFFFAWAIIPLTIYYPTIGVKTKKTKLSFPGLIVTSPIVLITHYVLWTIFYDGAKRGEFPPIFIWSSNLTLGLIGAIYLKKIH